MLTWEHPAQPYHLIPIATSELTEMWPEWSPDGKSIVYLAEVNGVFQVFVRKLSSAMPVQVTHSTGDCQYPFWSADRSRIYYVGRESALWTTGVAGAQPSKVRITFSLPHCRRMGKLS